MKVIVAVIQPDALAAVRAAPAQDTHGRDHASPHAAFVGAAGAEQA